MLLENKKVLVIGNGKSGKSTKTLLEKYNSAVTICDDYNKRNRRLLTGKFDFCVVSPGIKKTSQSLNYVIQNNIPCISEIDLGLLIAKSKIIGVTGTNGKTTTTELISHILNFCGKQAIACGNNGLPLTSVCESLTENKIAVIELSSFMLQSCKNLHCNISVFLNFKPDHLDFHKDETEYLNAKRNIFGNQKLTDFIILNADDEIVNKLTGGENVYYVSTEEKVKGTYVKNNSFYFFDGETETFVAKADDSNLLGVHNLQNVCVAITACCLMGAEAEKIAESLKSFYPPKHRLNLIYSKGFKVFNDSKATNVASTLASLSCFDENVILILGGSDKKENFDELFKSLNSKIKQVIITGGNRNKIKACAIKNDFNNYKIIPRFKKAVKYCLNIAQCDDVVLFSPASASFDHFKNFEERGEFFEKIVRSKLGTKKT